MEAASSPSEKSAALYQGTTLVVPHKAEKHAGFSPCDQLKAV
jgi:hypothetical protein